MNKDKLLMKLLKVSTISYTVAHTDKGTLRKVLRSNEDFYHYTLDAVPLDKETTKELLNTING